MINLNKEKMEVKTIKLDKGYEAIVDEEDYERLSKYRWRTKPNKNNVYAYRDKRVSNKQVSISMARELLGVTDSNIHVDHINRNSLDNRKSNLRLCTPQQNLCNAEPYGAGSKYKGVSFNKKVKKYVANIKVRKICYLGTYNTEEEAAKVYDSAALYHFKEFAYLNFPNEAIAKSVNEIRKELNFKHIKL